MRGIRGLLALALLAWSATAHAWSGGTNIVCQNGTCTISGQVAVANGGTGLSTVAQGDLLYGSAADTVSRLAKDTNATRYLANTGSSNNPAWAQVNVANGVTGTLPVGNGGTGATSWTANRCVRVNSGGTALEVAAGDCGTSLPPIGGVSTFGEITGGTTMHVGVGTADASQGRAQTIAPSGLSLDNLRCVSSVAPGGSDSFTITMADGACTGALSDSTQQVCTISASNRSCQEAGSAEAVTAGQCYAFKVVASATAATAVVTCGFERSA